MIRCDSYGVPKVVQKVLYSYGHFWFVLTLFDGSEETLDAGCVPHISLHTQTPSDKQFVQAEQLFLLRRYKDE